MYDFGSRLKAIRNQRGLTQKKLAEEIGKSVQAVSSYERNSQIPPIEVMISIADVLNVSLDYLVDRQCINTYYIYYVDWASWKLHRCNMDGSNSVVLVDQPVLAASMNFDDEYFYFRLYTDNKITGHLDCYDIYRFLKSDPTTLEKIVTLPVAVYQVFTVPGTGKIFVTTPPNGETADVIWVMDNDGTSPTVLEIQN